MIHLLRLYWGTSGGNVLGGGGPGEWTSAVTWPVAFSLVLLPALQSTLSSLSSVPMVLVGDSSGTAFI